MLRRGHIFYFFFIHLQPDESLKMKVLLLSCNAILPGCSSRTNGVFFISQPERHATLTKAGKWALFMKSQSAPASTSASASLSASASASRNLLTPLQSCRRSTRVKGSTTVFRPRTPEKSQVLFTVPYFPLCHRP